MPKHKPPGIYKTDLPKLNPEETALLDRLKTLLKTELAKNPHPAYTREELQKTAEKFTRAAKIPGSINQKLLAHLHADLFGWGKLEPLHLDEDVEDISCVGWEYPVYIYHRIHRDCETDIRFDSAEELNRIIARFAQKAGRQISLANPIVDATLEDGSRIQMTYGNAVSPRGSTFTIRKFRKTPYSIADLIKNRTITPEETAYLWLAVEYGRSILIIGATASGKTTTLNALTQFIPPLAKIVTLEDTHELMLCHGNWQPSVVPPAGENQDITLFSLVTAAMRQRPEYLIVGEVRGEETSAMFQAMNTGHTSFSTFHAGDFQNAANRLQNPPLNIPKNMIETLDIVISQKRFIRDGDQVRRCTEILEITGQTIDGFSTNTVFSYREPDDRAEFSGRSKVFDDICAQTQMTKEELNAEMQRRSRFLEELVQSGVTDFSLVTAQLETYRREDETPQS